MCALWNLLSVSKLNFLLMSGVVSLFIALYIQTIYYSSFAHSLYRSVLKEIN